MYHNAEHFPEPDIFRPERYLKNGELDDELCDRVSSAFGMGRRYVQRYVVILMTDVQF